MVVELLLRICWLIEQGKIEELGISEDNVSHTLLEKKRIGINSCEEEAFMHRRKASDTPPKHMNTSKHFCPSPHAAPSVQRPCVIHDPCWRCLLAVKQFPWLLLVTNVAGYLC